jgi:hypothetical protein
MTRGDSIIARDDPTMTRGDPTMTRDGGSEGGYPPGGLRGIPPSIAAKLSRYVKNNSIPNLLFHGEHLAGKRTIVQWFLYQCCTLHPKNILTIDCGLNGGIQQVRSLIKPFANTTVFKLNRNSVDLATNSDETNSTIVDLKFIVLTNADSLTSDAQAALRRCMEMYPNTRFIFNVTEMEQLITPIRSRLGKIHVTTNPTAISSYNGIGPFPPLDTDELISIISSSKMNESVFKFTNTAVANGNTFCTVLEAIDALISNNQLNIPDYNTKLILFESTRIVLKNEASCITILLMNLRGIDPIHPPTPPRRVY